MLYSLFNNSDSKRIDGAQPHIASAGIGHDVLRVATLNVGQGARRKMPLVLAWAQQHSIRIIGLQETGKCPHDHSVLRHFDYDMWSSPHWSAGVAILIHNSLHEHVVREWTDHH